MTLATYKYVFLDSLEEALEMFCKEAEKQDTQDANSGAITRTLYKGTQEEVILAIDYPPGSKPSHDSCVSAFRRVTNDCSPPSNEINPWNVKAGGRATSGAFTYRVEPQAERHNPMRAYSGGCKCVYQVFALNCEVWGSGWAANDRGKGLHDNANGCGAYHGFDFKYALNDK